MIYFYSYVFGVFSAYHISRKYTHTFEKFSGNILNPEAFRLIVCFLVNNGILFFWMGDKVLYFINKFNKNSEKEKDEQDVKDEENEELNTKNLLLLCAICILPTWLIGFLLSYIFNI